MDFRELSKWTAFCPNWTAFCPNWSKSCPKKFQKFQRRKVKPMPKIQVYGKIFKGEKIILNIIIFREKLKKMLYSLVEYGQKAVQITRQANNLDGFLSIWSASWPIFDRKSLNCYSKSKFRTIFYLSILTPLPLFKISRNSI